MPALAVELPVASDPASAAGRTLQLDEGDNLQQALDQARSGDTIVLPAGAHFRGPFVLRRRNGPGWVTIVSTGVRDGTLPPAGTRVTPADLNAMTLLSADRGSIISTEAGASHYQFIGLNLRPGNLQTINTLVDLSAGDNSTGVMPHHIVFARSYLHGDAVLATRRGIVMNGAHIAVIDSHLSGFKSIEDAQALVSWEGTGPFLIRNNHLEATGENVMFGGADPQNDGRVPSDISIVGNHFYKSLSWQHSHPTYDGSVWSVKNLLELKNAQRVTIDGNLFEHNWVQAQNGFAILFTVRNQDGNAPWSRVQDVVFSNNIVRHVGAAISILGRDDIHASEQTRHLQIHNNFFYDVGQGWGNGRLLQLLNSPAQLLISNNTALQDDAIMWLEGAPIEGASFINNIFAHNQTGISGTNTAPGSDSLTVYLASPSTIRGNVLIGCNRVSYPAGMRCVANARAAGLSGNPVTDWRRVPTGESPAAGVDFVALCDALSASERPDFCHS